MAERLTEATLGALVPHSGKRFEVSDERCIGLRVRISGDAKTFYFVGRPRGSKTVQRVTLGRWPKLTLAKARAAADRLRDDQIEGRDIVAETKAQRSDGVTFGKLVEEYIAHIKRPKGKASWKNDEGYLKRPLDRWRDRPARRLTRQDFAGLLSEIAETAPVSANRTQSVLRTLLGWAVDLGHLNENVLAGAKKYGGRETAKHRVLTDKEVAALDEMLQDPLADTHASICRALRAILLTGQRPGEVAGMRLDELIDLDGKEPLWTLPGERTKNKHPHAVPLSPEAVEIINDALNDLPRKMGLESDFVFASKWDHTLPVARHSLSQAMKRIVASEEAKALGLNPCTPHDLRRTAATLCQAAGIPRDHVEALLNHTRGDVTSIYARHHMLPEKRAAGVALGSRVETICGRTSRKIAG